MLAAAARFRLGGAIPAPHVTALYGFEAAADEAEVRRAFREDVRRVLADAAEEQRGADAGRWWPDLAATGIVVGAEFDGVDGDTMVRRDTLDCRLPFAFIPFRPLVRTQTCRAWRGRK